MASNEWQMLPRKEEKRKYLITFFIRLQILAFLLPIGLIIFNITNDWFTITILIFILIVSGILLTIRQSRLSDYVLSKRLPKIIFEDNHLRIPNDQSNPIVFERTNTRVRWGYQSKMDEDLVNCSEIKTQERSVHLNQPFAWILLSDRNKTVLLVGFGYDSILHELQWEEKLPSTLDVQAVFPIFFLDVMKICLLMRQKK
ncbi:hypothetical protein [Leptospira sp. GIMC2001]|uniref:hypothetical protein n=1 Tax=Leptospira sp. GIMC2001 TaxID=1513297 RepID=UPI002349CCA0|nr:hypothetical protein [Leptospira sp. GIMC2001]WCL48772.1 hypothetical protein O4O04_15900 [Leptospira sp. GIMC2001]